ncbi:MAG: PIN domain nuclease [Deltaproteobacteria bacterium]|nr:PIN domain nuclease [Deltaproteobacteria bacterium]
MTPRYLADKSALARLRHAAVDRRLTPLLIGGDVATCGIVDLELLYSARSHADLKELRAERLALPTVAMSQVDFDRAADVMERLAAKGQHRAVGLPDLLIAAAAERADLCVIHYDRDFDLIARVTSQRVEWVVPRGSVP